MWSKDISVQSRGRSRSRLERTTRLMAVPSLCQDVSVLSPKRREDSDLYATSLQRSFSEARGYAFVYIRVFPLTTVQRLHRKTFVRQGCSKPLTQILLGKNNKILFVFMFSLIHQWIFSINRFTYSIKVNFKTVK